MIYRALKKILGCHSAKVLYSVAKMSSSAFESIKKVDIDPAGTFKYILIKVYAGKCESDPTKMIVRGYKRCAYHRYLFLTEGQWRNAMANSQLLAAESLMPKGTKLKILILKALTKINGQ